MQLRNNEETAMQLSRYLLVMVLAAVAGAAAAQGWSPQKNVEIVVPNPPGGSNDKTARTVERIWTINKSIPSTLTIVNKSGAGGALAYLYTQQHAGDAHYLVVAGPALLTNHITGTSTLRHSDLTPVASLFNDYTVVAVNAGSTLRTGRDLVERLRKDPQSVTIAFSPSVGSHNHIAAGLLMKTIGGNARDLKVVAFKGSADAITNLLGGHVDVVTTAAGNVASHVASGKLRVIGISANQRFTGVLATVPTWKEQGVNYVFGAWRGVFAPPGLSQQQAGYWETALRKASEAAEWKSDLQANFWADDFVGGEAFRKELEQDYAAMKAVLVEIGFAR
jgi:putative tricarboxylic transport membrane protein